MSADPVHLAIPASGGVDFEAIHCRGWMLVQIPHPITPMRHGSITWFPIPSPCFLCRATPVSGRVWRDGLPRICRMTRYMVWLHAKRKVDFRLAIKGLCVENGLTAQAPARGAHWIPAHLTWHPRFKTGWMHGPHEQLKMLRREELEFSLFHV